MFFLLCLLLLVFVNLKVDGKSNIYLVSIILNTTITVFFIIGLYFKYIGDKITGTTFICGLITLLLIHTLIIWYRKINKKNITIFGYILSVIPLLFIIYSEWFLIKADNFDIYLTYYHESEILSSTNIGMLAVGTILLAEDNPNAEKELGLILNKKEVSNIQRYLMNPKGFFYEEFGGRSFNESINTAQILVGQQTKSIEQLAIKKNMGGDSAGLAMTLSSMIELQEIDNEIPIAVTGAVDILGNVNAVGAIPEKVNIASIDGYDYLIVPSSNFEEAKNVLVALNKKLNIIPVSSVGEAKRVVQELNIK